MDSLFKDRSEPVPGYARDAPAQGSAQTPAPAQHPAESEDAAVLRSLDELRAAVRSGGSEIPTLLTSRFAHIDDQLRIVIETVTAQGASTEQRVLLEAMIRDYLPTPLRAFLALPHDQRSTTSRATLQLSTQLGILEETIDDLLNQIRIGAIAELSTHGRFLQDKFAAPSLTLDGPS